MKTAEQLVEVPARGMDNWANILDENILKANVSFAALFVMNYECLKDYIISQVKLFYSHDISFENGEIICTDRIKGKLNHWTGKLKMHH